MNCEQYKEAILELVDGTLGPVRRAELQTHLDRCDDCRALVADLQKIRQAAASLEPVAPPDHVWMQIAGRLRQEGRVTERAPQARHWNIAALALAASLVIAIGGSLYWLYPRAAGPAPASPAQQASGIDPDAAAPGNAAGGNTVQGVEDEFRLAEQHLQAGIAKLEEVANADPEAIDPQTAATLQKNLEIIDTAIAESRAALNDEPQSAPARDSLFVALRQKVTLLQNTIALMNEMRKGNSAGAAELVDSTNKS